MYLGMTQIYVLATINYKGSHELEENKEGYIVRFGGRKGKNDIKKKLNFV